MVLAKQPEMPPGVSGISIFYTRWTLGGFGADMITLFPLLTFPQGEKSPANSVLAG
ncbi:hypothetical protein [Bradyrhizobium sp. AS23.2]|uniref:hypothetical protein n=1 Tax=Bradyrhizobium sp. AS23.2 TaxID=1680155 RepID=UPI0014304FA8|nr:hypothetical protein [Bradyrhizobium sp. AS23.2]